MMKDEPDDEPDDDDEPLDEVRPADEPDDDTIVTMAWQAMVLKQWREVPLPTAHKLLVVAMRDYVTRHVPGDEDLLVDACGEPAAEQLQDIANKRHRDGH